MYVQVQAGHQFDDNNDYTHANHYNEYFPPVPNALNIPTQAS